MIFKFSSAVLFACIFGISASGQCPTITVIGPSSEVKSGDTASFTATVSGGDKLVSPTYNWSISSGMIESGQGTNLISLDTTGEAGRSITVTVDVGGYMPACTRNRSWTISVAAKAVTRKYDEFNYLGPAKLEFARLDEFAITMLNEPLSKVHIIFYNGRKGAPGAIKAWTGQTVGRLTQRGVAKTRISTVDGGYRENGAMEIYVVPEGGETPYPSPTVDPSEIKPQKTVTKKVKSKKV